MSKTYRSVGIAKFTDVQYNVIQLALSEFVLNKQDELQELEWDWEKDKEAIPDGAERRRVWNDLYLARQSQLHHQIASARRSQEELSSAWNSRASDHPDYTSKVAS